MDSLNLELTPEAILENLRSLYLQKTQLTSLKPAKNPSKKKILVAFSGGLDSHVLLHLPSLMPSNEFELRAIYINHGLQVVASDWAKHCQQICDNLGVPFSYIELQLKIKKGESIEEAARVGRYQALYSNLQENEILLTAHHQNDQAETLLLQLFRGAGVQGLAAMSSSNKVNINGFTYTHLRPLLNNSRVALETYAKKYKLDYVEDPSNKDTAFDRNYLRNEIMPLLRERWLGIDKTISRSATIQAETKQLLDEMAEQKLSSVLSKQTTIASETDPLELPSIVISHLLEHSKNIQRLLLRYWITQQGFSAPSEKKLQHIFSDLIESAEDKQPVIKWKGAELRRFQQQLYLMSPLSDHDASQVITWDCNKPLTIYSLNLKIVSSILDGEFENTTIRFRQGGESIEIPKRGNISLKNLFQELKIPPWMRSRLPLIYSNEKLIKIVGLDYLKRHPPTF